MSCQQCIAHRPSCGADSASAAEAYAQERRELPQRAVGCANRPAGPFPARLPPLPDHIEHAGAPVDGEVEPGDNPVAVQEWHHKVTPARALRHVNFELEIEIPEGLRATAITD